MGSWWYSGASPSSCDAVMGLDKSQSCSVNRLMYLLSARDAAGLKWQLKTLNWNIWFLVLWNTKTKSLMVKSYIYESYVTRHCIRCGNN